MMNTTSIDSSREPPSEIPGNRIQVEQGLNTSAFGTGAGTFGQDLVASNVGTSQASHQASESRDEDRGGIAEQGGRGEDEGEDEDEEDDEDQAFLAQSRIDVGGPAWDESDDEDQDDDQDGAPLALSNSSLLNGRRSRRVRRKVASRDLDPLIQTRARWWKFLTNPGQPASLSAPHVSANLFAASLHPGVLLSMPHYFSRTGVPLGVAGILGVSFLGGVGGGLWVVLSRYVGGNSVEAITGYSFGKRTKWKCNIGKAVCGLLLSTYATGAAMIAYFAMADLLLQIFFHYSPKGIPLHDRAFVTLVVGGIITIPLLVFPLAKRNLIRLSTFLAVAFYPILVSIMLAKVFTLPVHPGTPENDAVTAFQGQGFPNANPLHPPSIWAPISLLPLMTLSSSPLQIIAHNRSLRRIGTTRSNVKAFMGAQAGQVLFVAGLGVAFGVGVGIKGIRERLKMEIHPNLFASLPSDDHLVNLARGLFILLLASHLALCLATARSSWGKLLRLLKINPLLKRRKVRTMETGENLDDGAPLVGPGSRSEAFPGGGVGLGGESVTWRRMETNPGSKVKKPKRQWGKLARNSLAGALLWTMTASTAYFSGAGGLRRKEKEGEELRFTIASEVLGLMGAGVGFVLPGLVWIVIFHIRRPRAILPLFASELGRTASAYFVGPQSLLARRRKSRNQHSQHHHHRPDPESRPLLSNGQDEDDDDDGRGGLGGGGRSTCDRASIHSLPTRGAGVGGGGGNEGSRTMDDRDEATTILLARKERQLQRRTRGRRLWQDILVLAAVLPFGVALLILGAIELRRGGY